MNQPPNEPIQELSPLKRALIAVKDMRGKLEAVEGARHEPLAIVGMACRFPGGAETPAEYWRLLSEGIDAVSEVPPTRWNIDDYFDPDPEAAGKMYTRWGGFLGDPDKFDPQFFGISPREAVSMDPQQRLLLEVAWEALENAGQPPDELEGTRTGVFVGISNTDYAQLENALADEASVDAYTGTGATFSVAAGRLSYVLGLRGPNVAVDTACSSSLVAIHMACQNLRENKCNLAIAGGVNLILAAKVTSNACRMRALAPDGRCKAFDASADGFTRAEGCGVLIIKRLSDARRDGDTIHAVIRGSAVNHDGRSSGLTVPNGPAQQAVLREALEDARLEASAVGFVEAHGTGTSLGDPIEVQSLSAVYARDRDAASPLPIGSVKTNIGHCEPAAGVAGLMKLVLALQHERIPPHLHLRRPTPHIAWDELKIAVPTGGMPWPRGESPRVAGVSAFGFSGTNAHILVGDAPVAAPAAVPADSTAADEAFDESKAAALQPRSLHVLPLSARTESALRTLAEKTRDRLREQPADFADLCYTAGRGRTHFTHRLAVVAPTAEEAADKLQSFLDGKPAAGIRSGRAAPADRSRVAFLFTGQGAQTAGMGRELYETEPVFREVLDRCDAALRDQLDLPLLDVLFARGEATEETINQTAYTQPSLFAVEVALAELWRSWGIQPAILMGHSVGEIAAAVVSGMISLEDGLRLIAARGRLMQALPAGGRMAAAFASEDRVRAALAGHEPKVSIAAVNGPENVVFSGDGEAVEAVAQSLRADKIKVQDLTVSHAFHSPLMDPMLSDFRKVAASITYKRPRVPLISNLTSQPLLLDEESGPDYWVRHAREAVRFADSVSVLAERGLRTFLEIGPHPVLLGMARRCVPDLDAAWLPSLRRKQPDASVLLDSLAELYVAGARIDWRGLARGEARRIVPMPNSPFERKSYWIPGVRVGQQRPDGAGLARASASDRPLLGRRVASPFISGALFESRLSAAAPAFLADHEIFGSVVFPATGFIEMALAAAQTNLAAPAQPGDGTSAPVASIAELSISEPLVFDAGASRAVQLRLDDSNADASFEIASFIDASDASLEPVARHATGKFASASTAAESASLELAELRARCAEPIDVTALYDNFAARGLKYGPAFRALTELHSGDGEALGHVKLASDAAPDAARFTIHPALLDACLHVFGAALGVADSPDSDALYLPVGLENLTLLRSGVSELRAHARAEQSDGDLLSGSLTLTDDAGRVVLAVERLFFRRADAATLRAAIDREKPHSLYEVLWQPAETATGSAAAVPAASNDDVIADVPPRPFQLSVTERGTLANLRLVPMQRRAPAPHEIEIEVAAGGINFRDVMNVLGMYPGDPGPLGNECAGRVVRVGSQVRGFAPGDEVMCLAEATHSTFVCADHRLASRIPAGFSLAAAATIPVTFLTAHYCLNHCARLQPGESVLIHAAAGGVGMAALQLAQARGLTIFATAGSDEKRDLLRSMGVPHVMNSRTLDFADDVMRITGGRGVDAVLNSLSDDFIPRSIGVLAQNGRFLEIGRRGIWDDEQVRALRPDVKNFVVLLGEVYTERPELIQQMYAELLEEFDAGRLHAPPFKTWPIAHAPEAFRFMAQARHVGKLVLIHDESAADSSAAAGAADSSTAASTASAASGSTDRAGRTNNSATADRSALQGEPIPADAARGDWLLIAPRLTSAGDSRAALARSISETLAAAGAGVHPIDFPAATAPTAAASPNGATGQAADANFRDRLDAELARIPDLRGIVFVAADSASDSTAESRGVVSNSNYAAETTAQLNALLGTYQAAVAAGLSVPMHLVTRGAQATADTDAANPAQAALWGLARATSSETPACAFRMIDLPGDEPSAVDSPADSAPAAQDSATDAADRAAPDDSSARDARAAVREILRPAPEPEVALRAGRRLLSRLHPISADALPAADAAPDIRPDAAYFITGGTGGLGLAVAHWLVRNGARHLALASRGEPNPAAAEHIAALRARNVTVQLYRLDIADRAALAATLERLRAALPPLRGIVHAAGVIDDCPLAQMDAAKLEKVLRPKIDGAAALHDLTLDDPLDLFVMFSSVASVFGSPGQGNYAAANAYLDALAERRRAAGRPALSINWGPWAEVGMAANPGLLARLHAVGIRPLSTDDGLATLGRLMARPRARAVVLPVDWSRFASQFQAAPPPPLLAAVLPRAAASKAASAGRVSSFSAADFDAADPEIRADLVLASLRELLAYVLRIQSADLEDDKPLADFGVDSLMAMEFRNLAQTEFAVSLSLKSFVEDPTLSKIGQRVLDRLQTPARAGAEGTPRAAASSSPSTTSSAKDDRRRPEEVLARLSDLSDAEVDALLGEMLSSEGSD